MEIAKIYVNGVRGLVMYSAPIPAGIVGATVRLEYSELWDGLHKTVVFKGAEAKDILDAGDVVELPPEVVAKPGYRLQVGVYGFNDEGTVVIPTLWADLGIVRDAADPELDKFADSALPVWAQLQVMIGDLEELSTEAKNSLVAAVNELAKRSGGEVDPEEVQRLVEEYLAENPPAGGAGGSGLTAEQISALDGMFKIASFTEDPTDAYAAFRAAFGIADSGDNGDNSGGSGEDSGGDSGGTEPDEPVVTIYNVTNKLTNVTNSNSAATASEFYSAMLTVADGCTMSSVVIMMGGVDVTADVYTADTGTILITALTGDIVITAVANQVQTISYASATSGMTFYAAPGTDNAGAYFPATKVMVLQARAGADSAYKIRVTNNTDADIAATIYYGDMIGTNVTLKGATYLYNSVRAKTNATIAAGSTVVIDATVHSCYYPAVATNGGALDFEFIGAIPEMAYKNTQNMTVATTNVKCNRYSADGNDGDSAATTYNSRMNYGENAVEEDTEVEIVISNDTDSVISIGYVSACSLAGTYTSGEANAYYNTKFHDNAQIFPGVDIVLNYTIRAGYKLGVDANFSSGGSIHYREV